jgi:hypothetical protein
MADAAEQNVDTDIAGAWFITLEFGGFQLGVGVVGGVADGVDHGASSAGVARGNAVCAGGVAGIDGRKVFFSEEKKQKTFSLWCVRSPGPRR